MTMLQLHENVRWSDNSNSHNIEDFDHPDIVKAIINSGIIFSEEDMIVIKELPYSYVTSIFADDINGFVFGKNGIAMLTRYMFDEVYNELVDLKNNTSNNRSFLYKIRKFARTDGTAIKWLFDLCAAMPQRIYQGSNYPCSVVDKELFDYVKTNGLSKHPLNEVLNSFNSNRFMFLDYDNFSSVSSVLRVLLGYGFLSKIVDTLNTIKFFIPGVFFVLSTGPNSYLAIDDEYGDTIKNSNAEWFTHFNTTKPFYIEAANRYNSFISKVGN